MLGHFVGYHRFGKQSPGSALTKEFDHAVSRLAWPQWRSRNGDCVLVSNCLQIEDVADSGPGRSTTSVSAVVGLLLLRDSSNDSTSVQADRVALCRSLEARDYSVLATANGTFAAAWYSEELDTLVLCTDSLGARPVYYESNGKELWFATSFQLLMQVSPMQHRLNVEALAEQFAFCYPLRERTLSYDTSVLKDNELLITSTDKLKVERYYEWKGLSCIARDPEKELSGCADAFRQAVIARNTEDDCQYALLSGGLDSRCIVASLLERNVQVQTATVAQSDSLDTYYAHAFAKAANVPISDVDGYDLLPDLTPGARTKRLLSLATSPFRGHAVFSGDGGGETFGFLIISPYILELLAQQKVEEALRRYSAESPPPCSILTSAVARIVREQPYCGMKEEFDDLRNLEPEKAFQLFLLRNDLRRHLHDYFDSIEETTCDLLLPFYDRRVVSSVLQIEPPLTDYIRHSFYYKLLRYLPKCVMSVRWQAYPKSLPCPLPGDDAATNQWNQASNRFRQAGAMWRKQALMSILRGDGLQGVVHRHRIVGAALLDCLKLRHYGYLFMEYVAMRNIVKILDSEKLL